MAKLTAKRRNKLPAKKFAQPAKRAYPIQDKAHAANAKARATQMHNRGILSTSAMNQIDARANRVLHKDKS